MHGAFLPAVPSVTTFSAPRQRGTPKLFCCWMKLRHECIHKSDRVAFDSLIFPEFGTEVVDGGNEGSNETSTPEPEIEVSLLGSDFFLGRRRRTLLQTQCHCRGLQGRSGDVVLDTIRQDRRR